MDARIAETDRSVAYLMNTYPVPSATFIRREIEAVEQLGFAIRRFAVRPFDGTLVDESDLREQQKVTYILAGNQRKLIAALGKELIGNPLGLVRVLPLWLTLMRNAGWQVVPHCAYLLQAIYFRQQAALHGIRHVHAHYATNAAAVAMLAHKLGGAAYSFTSHGPDEFVDPGRLSFSKKIGNAAFVVAISDYCRSRLQALSESPKDVAKIAIARCGIRLQDFVPTEAKDPGNQTIVCVGRLCPQKGQVHIPAAAARLKEEFPGLRIILVGDGESRAAIEAEIRNHGVAESVTIHGWASNPEVRRMIRDSRALLLPSYAEGLPVVLMEALALGRPAITTRIAGIPELIDPSCGWLIEPGNVDELAQAIRDCLACPTETLSEMGRTGRARVERMHDLSTLATALRQLFQGSLARAG
ncbi:glycosyltransferase family 4 protein [Rhizobium sp. YIM 134829]|uniref:glycosyltransferase family 4 protein n=1 Tax=Rhizobium sp. YIM 134829 TaxID=3390453 RepID=UPI00397D02EF